MYSKIFLLTIGVGLMSLILLGVLGVLGPSFEELFFGPGWTPDNPLNIARLLGGIALIVLALSFSTKGKISLALLLGIGGMLYGLYLLSYNLSQGSHEYIHNATHLLLPLWGIVSAVIDYRKIQ